MVLDCRLRGLKNPRFFIFKRFLEKEVFHIGVVKISHGNAKMGSIASVSLPAGLTCKECDCGAKCYAAKLERLRPNVREAYRNNLNVLMQNPDVYWREVEAALMTNRFFRFHVSGDIVDENYFKYMVEVVSRQKHCETLCFTKKYEIVNTHILTGCSIPPNLHIVFSGWPNLQMKNNFHLPEAHVRFKNGYCEARDDAKECGGNCTECAVTESGCWTLKKGEQIIFDEH